MLLNKKGVSWETVSKWIFALIVIAILWILFINLGDYLYGTGSKAACQNWVYRNSVSYIKEVTGNLESSPCVTTEETIKDIKDQNDLYEQLARNMYDCWDEYGQGESNFYSDVEWGASNTYCRICSEIKFDDNVKQKFREINIDDFEIYLNQHNPPNHKETYADFFTKAENSKLDFGSGKLPLDSNFYSVFIVNKATDWSAGGFFNKLVIVPASFFGLGSLASNIPGVGGYVKQVPKAVGGLVQYEKVTGVTKTISPILDASGNPIIKEIPVISKFKGGTGIGLAIMYVGVAGAAFLSDGSVLLPTLALIPSDSPKIQACDGGVYYNPEKKPLDILKK